MYVVTRMERYSNKKMAPETSRKSTAWCEMPVILSAADSESDRMYVFIAVLTICGGINVKNVKDITIAIAISM